MLPLSPHTSVLQKVSRSAVVVPALQTRQPTQHGRPLPAPRAFHCRRLGRGRGGGYSVVTTARQGHTVITAPTKLYLKLSLNYNIDLFGSVRYSHREPDAGLRHPRWPPLNRTRLCIPAYALPEPRMTQMAHAPKTRLPADLP